MKELLITGAWRCGEQQVQALEQMGYVVTFWPDERQAVNMDTQRFEAVICGGLFLTTPIERFVLPLSSRRPRCFSHRCAA